MLGHVACDSEMPSVSTAVLSYPQPAGLWALQDHDIDVANANIGLLLLSTHQPDANMQLWPNLYKMILGGMLMAALEKSSLQMNHIH